MQKKAIISQASKPPLLAPADGVKMLKLLANVLGETDEENKLIV